MKEKEFEAHKQKLKDMIDSKQDREEVKKESIKEGYDRKLITPYLAKIKELEDDNQRMIYDAQDALYALSEREVIQTFTGVSKQNEKARDILRNSLTKTAKLTPPETESQEELWEYMMKLKMASSAFLEHRSSQELATKLNGVLCEGDKYIHRKQ